MLATTTSPEESSVAARPCDQGVEMQWPEHAGELQQFIHAMNWSHRVTQLDRGGGAT